LGAVAIAAAGVFGVFQLAGAVAKGAGRSVVREEESEGGGAAGPPGAQ